MKRHIARQGECIASIATRYGVSIESIWDHPANAALRQLRGDPYVLRPGDIVQVDAPDRSRPVEAGATNRYRATIPSLPLRFQLRGLDGPRRGERFELWVRGKLQSEGTTDDDGFADLRVPANAVEGLLTVGETRVVLDFGCLNPADDVLGAQQRLQNLGFPCGMERGSIGPLTELAIRAFQTQQQDLPVTGELDAATCARLRHAHGS